MTSLSLTTKNVLLIFQSMWSFKDYTPEKVEKISGVSAEDIRYLAELYGNPAKKVMSLWCMGMNQHTRGTWINNLVYNIHLLTGKYQLQATARFR